MVQNGRVFIRVVILLFLLGIAAELIFSELGVPLNISRVFIWMVLAPLYVLLLYNRSKYVNYSRLWAIVGVIPPFAVFVGIYLYLAEPKTS